MAMGAPSGMNLMGMDLVSPSLLLRLALRSPAMNKIWVSYGLALVLIYASGGGRAAACRPDEVAAEGRSP